MGLALSSQITGPWLLADASIPLSSLSLGLILLGFLLGVVGSWTSLSRVLQAIAFKMPAARWDMTSSRINSLSEAKERAALVA